mgnify:CR=1 FL=1
MLITPDVEKPVTPAPPHPRRRRRLGGGETVTGWTLVSPAVILIGIFGLLPVLMSGSVIVSVVLDLPTTGPLLLEALMSQDMYLAGSFIMVLSTLTVIGTLISDLLLVVVDPRIKYE